MQSEIDMDTNLPPQNGEALLRQRLLGHEFPFDDSAWADLERQLDARAAESQSVAEHQSDVNRMPSASPLPTTIVMMLSVVTASLMLWQTADFAGKAHIAVPVSIGSTLQPHAASKDFTNQQHTSSIEQASVISSTSSTTANQSATAISITPKPDNKSVQIVDDHAPVQQLVLPMQQAVNRQAFGGANLSDDTPPQPKNLTPKWPNTTISAPITLNQAPKSAFSDDSMPMLNNWSQEPAKANTTLEQTPFTNENLSDNPLNNTAAPETPAESAPAAPEATRPAVAPLLKLSAPQLLPVQRFNPLNLQRFRIPIAMPLAETKVQTQHKNAISLYAGGNAGLPNYATPLELVPGFHVGISYFHPISEKWGIQVELAGRRMSGYDNLKLNHTYEEVPDLNSLLVNKVNAQVNGLYFVELPVLARYGNKQQRINWVFGLKPSMNTSFDAVETASGELYVDGNFMGFTSNDVTYTDTYIRQWIHKFDLNLVAGLEIALSDRFQLMARYHQGMRSLNWGTASAGTPNVYNTDFQVGIKARLF
jgi:hypothetical protein